MDDMGDPVDPVEMDKQADAVWAAACDVNERLAGVVGFKAAIYSTEDVFMTLAFRHPEHFMRGDRLVRCGFVYIGVKRR